MEFSVLAAGLLVAMASGLAAYRIAGPYGDGPFGAGYRRLADPAGGPPALVYDVRRGTRTVRTVVDEETRRMSELQLDEDADGVLDARAYVGEGGDVRVERDDDGDGAPDRWEYYRDVDDFARGRIEKVGFSLVGDRVVDAWAFYGADGAIARVEVSTARDGVVDRWEYYAGGVLARVGTDIDQDGEVDAWSTYEDGILVATAPGAGAPGGAGRADGAAASP